MTGMVRFTVNIASSMSRLSVELVTKEDRLFVRSKKGVDLLQSISMVSLIEALVQ
jgi:hypothetical protein